MEKILYIIKKIIPRKIFKKFQPIYHYFLNWFSSFIYRNPSEELIVIGVTGTTGKTTSSYMILKMLESAGFKVGLTSTAMFNDGKQEWMNDKKMTMIGRFFIQRIMRRMVKNGCQYAIIETTSEGIVQYRHKFINYDFLVFTGLYPEHIESHGNFENYKKAKGLLFKHLESCKSKFVNDKNIVIKAENGMKKIDLNRVKKTIIVNGDDEHVDYFLSFKSEVKFVYSKNENAKENFSNDTKIVNFGNIETDEKGLSFKVGDINFNTKLLGEFNAVNFMNAVSVGMAIDISMDKIKKGLENIKGIAGRIEKIEAGQDFTVIVDYAFEPNAVKNLYKMLDNIPGLDDRKIIHVLGSTGGGRDIARRPILGKIAGEKADFVIVTNEDPYDDDPEIIIDQVALGAERAGKKNDVNLFKISDRENGIQKAISLAETGDIVLITGKGNEQAICVANGEKIKWDDRAVTRECINNI